MIDCHLFEDEKPEQKRLRGKVGEGWVGAVGLRERSDGMIIFWKELAGFEPKNVLVCISIIHLPPLGGGRGGDGGSGDAHPAPFHRVWIIDSFAGSIVKINACITLDSFRLGCWPS